MVLDKLVLPSEIDRFVAKVDKLERGEISTEDFQKFRLENGIYGIRGATDLHMIRVKIPLGILNPEQLEKMAEAAEKFAPKKIGHITTRQDIQFHEVKRREVAGFLTIIAGAGLTTREACGNTVRNVTACPYAGVSPEEPFDVTPYAEAVTTYFLRNPLNQNLPRKFKFAFEGCREDHARTPIHDLGAVAAIDNTDGKAVKGFRIYVGGGLGPFPRSAYLLEPFTPAALLLPTAEAVLRLFDRLGERKDRNRARIKFVIEKLGMEEFRKLILAERKAVLATASGLSGWAVEEKDEAPPSGAVAGKDFSADPLFESWKRTNLFAQKQKSYYSVHVRCPLGDIDVPGMRAVADLARRFCGGRIRTTISQNFMLRWVHESVLGSVYEGLKKAGLAAAGAERFIDVTRCPGADTCNIAVTKSRGLAAELDKLFHDGLSNVSDLKDTTIKISGCPNSCGQHHIATLGFFGSARNIEGHLVPHYQMMIGGGTEEGKAEFGKNFLKVPARRVPEAVKKIIEIYRSERAGDSETLDAFIKRLGADSLKVRLAEFTQLPSFESAPASFMDWGDEAAFNLKAGKGECAV
ncbi:MAG: nitrite/sulfite reductase [Candidatus Omnitrophica bacterium]|nr:nitrite/sulfite reductase [Candidatus Omnitrophota bacterium]